MVAVTCHRPEGLTLRLHLEMKQADGSVQMMPTNEAVTLKGGVNDVDDVFWNKWAQQNSASLKDRSLLVSVGKVAPAAATPKEE